MDIIMSKKSNSTKGGASAAQGKKTAKPMSSTRRNVLSFAKKSAITVCVLGSVGGVWAYSLQGTITEQDLSRIGNGIPSVVQIHDPQCRLCQGLQRETRAALSGFGDDDVQYLVANITSGEGRRFADLHGVPHVTLLLFNEDGKLVNTLRGEQRRENLETVFANFIAE
jgi:hypothetical protein